MMETGYARRGTLALTLTLGLTWGCGGDGAAGADAGVGGIDATISPSADAARADAAIATGDPAERGAHDVHVADEVSVPVGGEQAMVTICSPSADGGATAAAGSFPLVIASPGFQLARSQYRSMCEHLASWGYVVLLQDYAGGGNIFDAPSHQVLAESIPTIIDWALGSGSGDLASRIDAGAIATAGHSLGGKVSILAAILDPRIKAVVGWDPVDAKPPIDNGSPSVTPELMGDLSVPLAVIGETLDGGGGFGCAPAADNYTQYVEHACAAPAVLEVTVDGADHMDWIDDKGSCGFTCGVCQNGPTNDATTRHLTRRLTTAWLEKHLRGTGGMDAHLSEPGIGPSATVRVGPGSGC